MSIRKIWAADAAKNSLESKVLGRKSKKPCAKVSIQCSPSRIPISPHMKAQLKGHTSHMMRDKENRAPLTRTCDTLSTSGGSLGSTQSSEIVLRAAELAKNRRSSCGCRLDFKCVRDSEFRRAANQVGLPRTSTETGFTKCGQGVCNVMPLPPLDDISCISSTTKEAAARKMVHNSLITSNALTWQPRVQHDPVPARNGNDAARGPHWGSSHVVGLAPAIPPKTYLAKMAHAKAHLARTAVPHFPRAQPPPCGTARAEGQERLAPERVKTAGHIPLMPPPAFRGSGLERGQSLSKPSIQLYEGKVSVSVAATSGVPPDMSSRIENNPSYGLTWAMRTSRDAGCKGDPGALADDEITVLNCSCQRCLMKFSSAAKQEWQKRRSSSRNLSCRNSKKPQAPFPPPPKAPKYPDATVGDHCCCCNCRRNKDAADHKPAKAPLVSQSKAKVVEFHRGEEKEPYTAEATVLRSQDDITRIVELAVKASLEKILSLNSLGFLGTRKKCRSLEDLQVLSQRKVTSPAKYILLSACTSGKPVTDGSNTKTESGLGISQRSCSVDDLPSAKDLEDISHDLYNTFLGLRSQGQTNGKDADRKPGTTSEYRDLPISSTVAQPLVDSGALLESTKISTAFIRLIKTEASTESGKVGDAQWLATAEDENCVSKSREEAKKNGAVQDLYSEVEVPRAAADSSTSGGVGRNLFDEPAFMQGCNQNPSAESAAILDCKDKKSSASPPRAEATEELLKRRSTLFHSGRGEAHVPSDSRAGASLGPGELPLSNIRSLGLPSEECTSSTSASSLPSRKSPDGWERTPTSDASVPCVPGDEPSELNLGVLNGEELCSGNSSTDDDRILEEVIRKGMGVTPHAKLPLKYPKSPSKSARRYKPGEYFSGKAKLKLAAYTNSGHITVHVIRAVKLVTSRGHSANSYVKVSLQPDLTRRTLWRTAVVKSCRNPEYDHKFSFELMPEDSEKRLLITVWHRDLQSKHSELLGSMSFSMAKILGSTQYARGWYRLLKQDLGARKHFAAKWLQKGSVA